MRPPDFCYLGEGARAVGGTEGKKIRIGFRETTTTMTTTTIAGLHTHAERPCYCTHHTTHKHTYHHSDGTRQEDREENDEDVALVGEGTHQIGVEGGLEPVREVPREEAGAEPDAQKQGELDHLRGDRQDQDEDQREEGDARPEGHPLRVHGRDQTGVVHREDRDGHHRSLGCFVVCLFCFVVAVDVVVVLFEKVQRETRISSGGSGNGRRDE